MKIGGFVSAAGGLHKAIERAEKEQFEVPMFFIGSPNLWVRPELSDSDVTLYKKALVESNIVETYAHAQYLANLATPDPILFQKSVDALTKTMQNGNKINLTGLIFHPGSHKGTSIKEGLNRVAKGMRLILDLCEGSTLLILENTVKQGDKVGTSLDELQMIFDLLDWDERVKVCWDTCHSFASGYDYAEDGVERLLDDLNKSIGLSSLACFHINDSQGELNSYIDRHANLGHGHIGLKGFKKLVNTPEFQDKAFILEIPGTDGNGPSLHDRKVLESLYTGR